MENKYFMHRIKHTEGENGGVWDKGIEVHDTPDAARQAYHAYLGAYAYGKVAAVDYVKCRIDDVTSGDKLEEEEWIKPEEPEPEPEE